MSKNEYRNLTKPNKLLIPVILMMGFVPLIVHMYQYNANLAQFDWFPDGADSQIDFFFAWKMIAIIVLGVVMVGILLYRHFGKKERLQFENSFYLLMVYGLFVLMSALFSRHKYWVVRGTYELFEPIWVVCIYMILCYYVYHFVNEEKQVDVILRWSGIGMAIVTLIGVFQYGGFDFFKTSLGKHLISDTSWWGQLDSLQFNFAERTSYTTLYNPNFLSFYFGMLIPLLLCLLIGAKKMWHRVLFVIAEVFCVICLIGSASMTGWMALAIGAVLLALVLLSRNKKLFAAGGIVVVIGIIAALVLGNTTGIGRSIRDTVIGTYHIQDQFALSNVQTNDDNVVLTIRGNDLTIAYTVGDDGTVQILCKDADGNDLGLNITDASSQISTIADERFADVQVQPVSYGDDTMGVCVTIENVQWNFINVADQGYLYVNAAGKAVKYDTVNRSKLFRDDAMSLRGHIWDNTIPLLAKHIFMGSGANTFMFEYPQNDYISQSYIYGQNNFDVKAHSWYLQQWVETGLLGTLALLGFIIWYLVRSIRIYRRVNLHERLSWIGFGLFSAVLVYLLAAIVNDSNVCTAPVFWTIFGLGLAVNRMLVKKENLFAEIEEETVDNKKIETGVGTEDTQKLTTASGKTVGTKKQSRKQRKNKK